MATEMNHGNQLSPMQNGTVATEISGTMATETILSYWHCITEMTGTTCSEMGGTVATELSTQFNFIKYLFDVIVSFRNKLYGYQYVSFYKNIVI